MSALLRRPIFESSFTASSLGCETCKAVYSSMSPQYCWGGIQCHQNRQHFAQEFIEVKQLWGLNNLPQAIVDFSQI